MYARSSRWLPLSSEGVFDLATDTATWSHWWDLGRVQSDLVSLRSPGDAVRATWDVLGHPVIAEWLVTRRVRQIVHLAVDTDGEQLARVTFAIAPWFDGAIFESRVTTPGPPRGSRRLARRLDRSMGRFAMYSLTALEPAALGQEPWRPGGATKPGRVPGGAQGRA